MNSIDLLREIQKQTNTKNDFNYSYESFKPTFEGLISENEIQKKYTEYIKHLKSIDTPTEYENPYYYEYLKKHLDLLYESHEHVSMPERNLNFEKPIIGTVRFNSYNASSLLNDNNRIILISRSIIHFSIAFSKIIAQYYYNKINNLCIDKIDNYFIDLACSYYINKDLMDTTKTFNCKQLETLDSASSLTISNYFFIVAHEYSHLILEHQLLPKPTPPSKYESEADFLGAMLCIKTMINHGDSLKNAISAIGYSLLIVDLLYDINNIILNKEWDVNTANYPYPRYNILLSAVNNFTSEIDLADWIDLYNLKVCVHNLWYRNESKIKEYLTFYNNKNNNVCYSDLQKMIYKTK